MMSMSLYRDIMKTIQANKFRDCQTALEEKYPTVSTLTLGSILSNYVQKQMKTNHSRHNTSEKIVEYYDLFVKAVEQKEPPGVILRLSDQIEITPVLVSRFIIEGYLRQKMKMEEEECEQKYLNQINQNESLHKSGVKQSEVSQKSMMSSNFWSNIRPEITRLLRDTTEIEDGDLAYEVYLCTVHDDHYGPIPDAIRQNVGLEYENMLRDKLKELKVCFMDENQLRQKGYDKTPDFKLDVPIAIEGRVVNWIESKATFGDEVTHQTYLEEQLTSYWNRFGPGLVIYWLGYVETLESRTSKSIFVRDHLPTAITYMNTDAAPSNMKVIIDGMFKEQQKEPNAFENPFQKQ